MPWFAKAPRRPAQRQALRAATVPAPNGGINAVDSGVAIPPSDAMDLVNMVGGRVGLTSRYGFAEWCIGMGGNPVRSVIPFTGSTPANDRLFAATSTDIFDCTTSSATPSSVHTFGTSDATSGFGVSQVFETSAGHFLFHADETNGLLRYDESTDTWAAAASITGVSAADLVFVTAWKNRLLFAERDTGNLWFLPVGYISGTAAVVRLGNRAPHGGYLVGAWSWTIDGGAGVDDFLVCVFSSGDVLIYQGDDPATAGAFNLVGTWFVGAVPKGRRIATDIGGDLLLLSLAGVVPVSKLRSGSFGPDMYTTRKIAPKFNEAATTRRDLWGWQIALSPTENALIVNMPRVGDTYEQFAMSISTQGWSRFQGVPSLSMAPWGGDLYVGTLDGRVCKVTGDLDDVKIDGAATYSEIDWSGLSAFSDFGAPAWKQVHEIEPIMWTQGAAPGYGVEARYDFDTSTISSTPPDPATEGIATWDAATWDTDVWPGIDVPCGGIRGATGMGMRAAVAFRGRSNARTTLMGFRVRWTDGGIR